MKIAGKTITEWRPHCYQKTRNGGAKLDLLNQTLRFKASAEVSGRELWDILDALERKQAALEKYGDHTKECWEHQRGRRYVTDCVCGYEEALE